LKRNVFTVFLASPGDLVPERNITREVVERINKVISRRANWHIELLGWEDTLPGYSRPQDIINKDVDCCDLLLGLLWKRWGQETGKYTSGFHEEFSRARERRMKSGIPEIWLFFKGIGSDNMEDPGEQLKKVLQFKKEQIEQKKLFFKEFANTESWEKVIYDQLMAYVLDLAYASQEAGPVKAMPAGKEKEKDISISGEKRSGGIIPYPAELRLILQKTSNRLGGQENSELDFWDKTRLFLLASSWFSSVHLDEHLGVHEVNLVYSQRKSWELSAEEFMLVFRTIVTDKYNTSPGWYWFKGEEEELMDDGLCSMGVADKDKETREMAFTLMRQTGFRPPRKIIEKGLSDNENEVILKVIELLAHTGLSEDVVLLDGVLSSKESAIKNSAVAARLDLLYRADPNNAFREYAKVGGNRPIFIDIASKEMNLSVDQDVLLESLKSPHTEVRRFATGYLRALKNLDGGTAKGLLEDIDSEVRRQALWALVELGEKITVGQVKKLFPPQKPKQSWGFGLLASSLGYYYGSERFFEEFYEAILKQTSPEEILASLDTYDSYVEISYRYIAMNHFRLIENRIRRDLDNEFADLIGELDQMGWESDTVDFVKAKMIKAALAGLAENGNKSDLKYGRRFIGKTRHNTADPEAVKLVVKYGDVSDVERLLEVALADASETRRIALEGALKLADDKIAVLEIMLRGGDGETVGKAAEKLWVLDKERVREISRAKLNEDDSGERLVGLAILVKFYEEADLELILNEYIATSPHYYNVVTWLDKALYAPGRYGECFRKKLVERLLKA
jgi:hypothetical protein